MDTFNLAKDLDIVPCDDVSTEIHLVVELLVEHRQDLLRELIDFFLYLLLCGLRLNTKADGHQHFADALGDGPHFLVKCGEELLEFRVIGSHVHFVLVRSGLVPVCYMHH